MKTLESFQDHSSKMFQSDEQVFDHFRRWGYLTAQLDPIGPIPASAGGSWT